METTLIGVSAAIAAKLTALVDSGTPAKRIIPVVREYAGGDATSYPLAEVLPTGGSTVKREDSARNGRVFTFEVLLYQEQSEAGESAADATIAMRTACDKVIEAFDRDKDLGGAVYNCLLTKMSFDYASAGGVKIFATFSIDCAILVPSI